MKRRLRALGRVLLGALYPPRCIACRAFIPFEMALGRELETPDQPATTEGHWFCPGCLDRLPHLQRPFCPKCAMPQTAFLDDASSHRGSLCKTCTEEPPSFEGVHAVCEYGGAAKEAIHRLKFGGDASVAKGLGALLAQRVQRDLETQLGEFVILAVPPDPGRKERLDHSALIAANLGARLGIAPSRRALERVRTAPPQRELSREARLTNLVGVFRADSSIVKGRKVLLVDDVMTTGATVREATLALVSEGAQRVDVAVFCRTF